MLGRPLLTSVVSVLLSALLLATLGALPAHASGDPVVDPSRYVVGGCRISFTSSGQPRLLASAGRPCVGVTSVAVDPRGDVNIRLTKQATYPVIRLMVQAGPVMNERGIVAGVKTGGTSLTMRLYDDQSNKRLDLRSSSARKRAARTDVTVGWTAAAPAGTSPASLDRSIGYNALGVHRDRSATSRSTVPGGCVVRFDSGTPRIHTNATHRCIGVRSVRISSTGNLQASYSKEQAGAVVNVQADPDETLTTRGLVTGASTTGSSVQISFYDGRIRRRLDLRRASDLARVSGKTANVWLTWTKTTARPGSPNATTTAASGRYGVGIDGSVDPGHVFQRGCRIRFTDKAAAVTLQGNKSTLCTGVATISVTAKGNVRLPGGFGSIVTTTSVGSSGATNLGLRAGLSGGTSTSELWLYSLRLNRRLDLRKAKDRALVVADGSEMLIGWSHYGAP